MGARTQGQRRIVRNDERGIGNPPAVQPEVFNGTVNGSFSCKLMIIHPCESRYIYTSLYMNTCISKVTCIIA